MVGGVLKKVGEARKIRIRGKHMLSRVMTSLIHYQEIYHELQIDTAGDKQRLKKIQTDSSLTAVVLNRLNFDYLYP